MKNIYPPNTATPFEVRGVKSSLVSTVADHDNHDTRQGEISNKKKIQLQKYKEKKANETTEIRKGRLAKLRDMQKYQSSDRRACLTNARGLGKI